MGKWAPSEQHEYDFKQLEEELSARKESENMQEEHSEEIALPRMKRTHIMEDGKYVTLWDGKRPEEFDIEDQMKFAIDTDLQLHGFVQNETKDAITRAGYQFELEKKRIVIKPLSFEHQNTEQLLQELGREEDIRHVPNIERMTCWNETRDSYEPIQPNISDADILERRSRMEKPGYKAYAYANGQKKPTILVGESKEEIFTRIQNWNKGRTAESQYTHMNIGKISYKENRYCDFVRYDAAGKDISNTYLTLPSLPKEEFSNLIKTLKENGAKFNPIQKKWYITHNIEKEKFAEYILDPKGSLSEDPLEKVNSIDTKDIYFTVGMNPKDNFCIVYLPGMEPVVLEGSEYCVSFPTMPLEKVKEIVNKEAPLLVSVEENITEQRISKLDPEQRAYIEGKKELIPAQIDEVILGFEQGFNISEVETYATKDLKPWQMEMCRNGIYYGIKREEMALILEPLRSGVDMKSRYERFERAAEEKRLELARVINKTGFQANRNMVGNILQLNHITKKSHSVADLASAYRDNLYKDNPKAADLVEKIGKDFARQERERAMAQ